ncbi:MAG: hypothetical protein QNK37_02655 [Acidobacteriota bacterium]|nr:hypothetical protein [Acidobacteriota bacterium]
MELTALEREIERRTPEEQNHLLAHLTAICMKREPGYLEEIDRRLEDPSGWMNLDDLKQSLGDVRDSP